MESKILKAELMESYTLKVQELTINVLKVKLIESPPIIIKSNTLRTLESTVDTFKALSTNVIKASLVESTSTLLKL
jgi:hypothetical protein